MYTPINRHKLSAEGRKVFDMIEENIRKMRNFNATVKNIRLSGRQYDSLLEGTPAMYHNHDDGIPFGDFKIGRVK